MIRWADLERSAEIVRYDARGHGDSAATPAAEDYHWDRLALDLLGLADALELGRFTAGGVSMGTATALHAALAAPERIAALVLAAPPTAWETRASQADQYRAGAALVEAQGTDAFNAQAAKQPPPALFAEAAEVMQVRPRIAEAALPTVLRGAAGSDLPPREALRALEQPTLILAWDTDPGHPLSTAEALADLLPNARLEVARKLVDLGTWTGLIADFLGAAER